MVLNELMSLLDIETEVHLVLTGTCKFSILAPIDSGIGLNEIIILSKGAHSGSAFSRVLGIDCEGGTHPFTYRLSLNERQHVLLFASVAIDGNAFASQSVDHKIDFSHIFDCCSVGQIDRLGHGVVRAYLKCRRNFEGRDLVTEANSERAQMNMTP